MDEYWDACKMSTILNLSRGTLKTAYTPFISWYVRCLTRIPDIRLTSTFPGHTLFMHHTQVICLFVLVPFARSTSLDLVSHGSVVALIPNMLS